MNTYCFYFYLILCIILLKQYLYFDMKYLSNDKCFTTTTIIFFTFLSLMFF